MSQFWGRIDYRKARIRPSFGDSVFPFWGRVAAIRTGFGDRAVPIMGTGFHFFALNFTTAPVAFLPLTPRGLLALVWCTGKSRPVRQSRYSLRPS